MKDEMLLSHIRLHFNINYPTLEECYLHGYESALAEMNEDENPFSANSKEHEEWSEGWWAGFYGEPPLFDLPEYPEYSEAEKAANDYIFPDTVQNLLLQVMEVAGILAVSATVGYQIIDLVA